MKLAAKLAVAAIAVGIVGTVIDEFSDQWLARREHEHRVDDLLIEATTTSWLDEDAANHEHDLTPALTELLGSAVFQVVTVDGEVNRLGQLELPVDDAVRQMLAGERTTPMMSTITIDGLHYRYAAAPRPGLGVAQAAVSLESVDALVGASSKHLTVMAALSLVFGAFAAIAAARWLIRPLTRLADASQTVAATGRFDVPLETSRTDEVGVLARSFRGMLDALAHASDAQQRIVEDVGHELRTPVTSLRTNIELLERHPAMPDDTRTDILRALSDEVREMSSLIDRLRESWTTPADGEQPTDVRLDWLVEELVAQFRRRTDRPIDLVSRPVEVTGRPSCLRGAVGNLIDNALKFDPSRSPIEVSVGPDGVWVRDHGPGIDPAEHERVFERFHRAAAATHIPGTGIGLSLVAEAARHHGGTARASNHPDGGAVVGFTVQPRIGTGEA